MIVTIQVINKYSSNTYFPTYHRLNYAPSQRIIHDPSKLISMNIIKMILKPSNAATGHVILGGSTNIPYKVIQQLQLCGPRVTGIHYPKTLNFYNVNFPS